MGQQRIYRLRALRGCVRPIIPIAEVGRSTIGEVEALTDHFR
jgi:hypothetical protein